MTRAEINNRYDDLRATAISLENAMKKFEGTKNVENYLCYSTLSIALECI